MNPSPHRPTLPVNRRALDVLIEDPLERCLELIVEFRLPTTQSLGAASNIGIGVLVVESQLVVRNEST